MGRFLMTGYEDVEMAEVLVDDLASKTCTCRSSLRKRYLRGPECLVPCFWMSVQLV